jgi:Icc-related predicted phosphoesterase
MKDDRCRIFYAADIHGSETCFRKWLNAAKAYRVDALILGGDLTGKIVAPVVQTGQHTYASVALGAPAELSGGDELVQYCNALRRKGRYPVILSPDEKHEYDQDPTRVESELFPRVVDRSLRNWVDLAEERLAESGIPAYVMLGNDDYPHLQSILEHHERIISVDGRVTELPGGFELLSLGFSNRTPWDSPRELDEEDLAVRVEEMASSLKEPESAVFNLHCPPFDSQLDTAAVLDENLKPRIDGAGLMMGPVGSSAVRSALEKYQPVLSVHGHIHESAAGRKIGRTTSVNPGSEYGDGVLKGAIIELSRRKGVRSWQLVQG